MAGLGRNGRRSDNVSLSGGTGKSAAHPVYFTPEQIAWLENTFPEPLITPETTMEKIQNVAGKRELIMAMKARVRSMATVQL
jgi:hypothetical protein